MKDAPTDLDPPRRPVIAVVGAGAVGGYYGAKLARAGFDVHFLLRGDYEAVRANGWVVRSVAGDFTLPPGQARAYRDPQDMPPADLVVVTLKSTANDQLGRLVSPLLKPGTAVLTLQNGLGNEESLAGLFGAARVLGGMAFVCINRLGPGVIQHTAHGHIRLGEFDRGRPPGPSPRAARVAELFQAAGVGCDVLDDLRYGRWEKLTWNIPFNGLSVVLDQTTDLLLAGDAGEALVRSIMAEVVATARAAGAALPDESIDVHVQRTRSMGAYRTSSHVDRLEGRPLEVEAIFGHPLREARRHGVATPRLEMLYRMVCVVDAEIRRAGMGRTAMT